MQRALLFESQDRLDDAAADMQRAIDREPFNWRPPLLLSRIEAERGHVGPALRAYRTFKRLRPKSLFKETQP
jgi:cytochrome c-type biogenesis protein CcmH/NrfG